MMEICLPGDTETSPPISRRALACICFYLLMIMAVAAIATSAEDSTDPGAMDLLQLPATLSRKAAISPIMDISRIGTRLIAVGARGHILYSTDSGQTWTQVKVPVSVTLTAVCFPSLQTGWAVGHDGVILRSDDGGRTWRKQIDGTAINALMRPALQTVIAAQRQRLAHAGQDRRAEIETKLENLSFFLDDINLAIAEGPTRPLMDVWFKNEREGIVVGAFGMILGTVDGGENWTPWLDRIDNPDGFHYYGICRSGDDLYIAGEAGMLFRSDDWGQHWQRLQSPYDGSFFGIIGSDDGTMQAAFGLRGSLFLSHDKGKTWTAATNHKRASVSGGAVLADGTIVFTCIDGTIMQSQDNGKTFSVLPTRFPGSIAITETSDGELAVAGLRGVTLIEK
jgi:photosystem II stability/assembly factor-like uncharacterized protein